MCGFCNFSHTTKGGVIGKPIDISKCANETDLTDCQIARLPDDDKYGVIIFSHGAAKGYFEIEFCPKCGKKLNNDLEQERI